MSTEFLTRIAALETELAKLRGNQRSDQPVFDKKAFLMDPSGYLARVGMTPEELRHVNTVNLAVAMGDQAPPDMKYLAQQGPVIAQQSALATQLEQLSRQVQELVSGKTKEATASSLKALITDKEKYPHFSKAFANDPALLESKMVGRTGTAEEIAQALETEAAAFAKAFGIQTPPASDEAGKDEAAQSQQSKPASSAGGNDTEVPPLPGPAGSGPMTPDEDRRLQEELARKYGFEL